MVAAPLLGCISDGIQFVFTPPNRHRFDRFGGYVYDGVGAFLLGDNGEKMCCPDEKDIVFSFGNWYHGMVGGFLII